MEHRTLAEDQNTDRTLDHWWNNGTPVEQSECHGIVEHEKSSGITEK